jgi:hypothetical protein
MLKASLYKFRMTYNFIQQVQIGNSSLFNEFVCNLGFFWHEYTSAKKAEYNVFLFDEPPKGSKSLKIFKISMTFRFDKLSNLSKSVHTGENSQILFKIIFKDKFLSFWYWYWLMGIELLTPDQKPFDNEPLRKI